MFSCLENEIELYLRKHYTGKDFVFFLNADALVPAFTITIVSHYESKEIQGSVSLVELIDWYKENACYEGLEIVENQLNDDSKEDDSEETFPDSVRTYIKIFKT